MKWYPLAHLARVSELQALQLLCRNSASRIASSYRGKHLIGDITMVILKFRPRWPHTWRYALHSLSRPTMTSGHQG